MSLLLLLLLFFVSVVDVFCFYCYFFSFQWLPIDQFSGHPPLHTDISRKRQEKLDEEIFGASMWDLTSCDFRLYIASLYHSDNLIRHAVHSSQSAPPDWGGSPVL